MADHLTPEERERLTSAMVAARTEPGYWFDGGSGKIGDAEPEAGIGEMDNENDAVLAVLAVNALPRLLASLDAQEAEIGRLRKVAEAAERVCLMVGWTGIDNSERGKALTELWMGWVDAYRAAGGSTEPVAHPELSNERIRELAARRDAKVAAILGFLTPESTEAEAPLFPGLTDPMDLFPPDRREEIRRQLAESAEARHRGEASAAKLRLSHGGYLDCYIPPESPAAAEPSRCPHGSGDPICFCHEPTEPSRLVAEAARGARLIRVAPEFLAQFAPRTDRGERITAEWGEPDEYGVYEPAFTVHYDDSLLSVERIAEALSAIDDSGTDPDWLAAQLRAALLREGGASPTIREIAAKHGIPVHDNQAEVDWLTRKPMPGDIINPR